MSSDAAIGVVSFVFAIAVVVAGAIVQVRITKAQIKAQLAIADRQIKAETATAIKQVKAQVLSKNRQAWINSLRITIAETISLMSVLPVKYFVTRNKDGMSELIEHVCKVKFSIAKTTLLINPMEEDHSKLISLLDDAMSTIAKLMQPKADLDMPNLQTELNDVISKVSNLTQVILKREWERVKELD